MVKKIIDRLSGLEVTKPVMVEIGISQKHYKALEQVAKQKGRSVEYYLKIAVEHNIEDIALWAGVLCTFLVMCSTCNIPVEAL